MIEYHYENNFRLDNETKYTDWINRIMASENAILGPIHYIFCDDTFLLAMNQKYLNHDTLTDIISFDYSDLGATSGDIFISIERVEENAVKFETTVDNELRRVMAHGLLHLLGYNDKNDSERSTMRAKENEKINMFHVEQ